MTTLICTGYRSPTVGFLIPDNPNECWEWRGYVGADGYGQAKGDGKTAPAHRVVWSWLTGQALPPKSSGLELHHTCHNRRCVNPGHLELITIASNRERRTPRTPAPVVHGTITGYGSRKCRCPECRAAWSAYQRERYYVEKAENALWLREREREPAPEGSLTVTSGVI